MRGDDPIGALFGGRYRARSLLGRGGMGSAYAAVDEVTGRAVALKVLDARHAQNHDAAERFAREARVAATLKHPNLVELIDPGESTEEGAYMVLELLDGEALARLMRREKPMAFARAAEILLPVMRAVAYAHEQSVLHRDVKPENIFLHRDVATGAVVPKVLDFGIAKPLNDRNAKVLTVNGDVMGTPAYMSPEQVDAVTDRIGPPTDVWSMGVIWYEALTGELPFGSASTVETLIAVRTAKYARLSKRLSTVSASVANAIDKALVRDSARRYPDMGAFLSALTRAVAEGGDSLVVSTAPAITDAPTAPASDGEAFDTIVERPRSAPQPAKAQPVAPANEPPAVSSATQSVAPSTPTVVFAPLEGRSSRPVWMLVVAAIFAALAVMCVALSMRGR